MHKTRILAFLLALFLLATLPGCAGAQDDADTQTADNGAGAAIATEDSGTQTAGSRCFR